MRLLKGQSFVPFWGDYINELIGEDQLGIQISSYATYSTLLRGITGTTYRIRYYGFYCWVLELYAKFFGVPDKNKQRDFIKRAEAIIALVMKLHNPDYSRIPGGNHAVDVINNSYSSKIDFSYDAANNRFWKNPIGIYGALYKGAMQAMGLIETKEIGIDTCTNMGEVSGTLLAEAFDKGISKVASDAFIKTLNTGVLNKSESKLIYDNFSISRLELESEECKIYERLLIQDDYQTDNPDIQATTLRKDSIRLFLSDRLSNRNENWGDFIYHLYINKGCINGVKLDASIGWYYYQLNTYWHIACENLLLYFLYKLENVSPHNFRSILDMVQASLYNAFVEHFGIFEEINDYIKVVAMQPIDNYSSVEDFYYFKIFDTDVNADKRAVYSVALLLSLYYNNNLNIEELKAKTTFYFWDRGEECLDGLQRIQTYKNQSLKNYLKNLIEKQIVGKHLEIAYSKMSATGNSTLKFSLDDGKAFFKNDFKLAETNPRINTLFTILSELGYICDSENGELTTKGLNLLKKIS